MILTCNSCEKRFVVPDQAITAAGRSVQCGSCGNKWKQFPIESINKKNRPESKDSKIYSNQKQIKQKIKKSKKTKKNNIRKSREMNLYSPEYLAKKHGIKLNQDLEKTSPKEKVSFGFYNSLLLFLVIVIIIFRGLYFFQDFVVQKLPFSEFYIDYIFESIRNMFEIWKSLISNY